MANTRRPNTAGESQMKDNASDPLSQIEMTPLLSADDPEGELQDFGQHETLNFDVRDILGTGPADDLETPRKSKERSEWGGNLRAIVAELTPAVGLRFRAWLERHKDTLPAGQTGRLFSLYIEHATYRDALADEMRDEADKQYDWAELHMQGLRPLIESEVQTQRESIARGMREAMRQRLKAMVDRGTIPKETLEAVETAGVIDND